MSGPMAASFGIGAGVLVAAQSIAQGAAEIAAGMAAAAQQAETLRQQRRAERQEMRAAQQAGAEKQRRAGEADAARLRRLLAVWQGLGQADTGIAMPAAPAVADGSVHAAYLAQLAAGITKLEALLDTLAASRGDEIAAALDMLRSAGVSAQEQLAAYLAQARLAGASAAVATARQQLVERVIERLALDADEVLPAALDALATQVVQAPSEERAAALATELRYQAQRHNEAHAADAREKSALAGRQQLQEAAAVVLEQSLKDLGYSVEEIEETLFVEGGVAHFQHADWGDYFIRLRIDPQRNAMNFNVVRAGTPAEDRRREDMLAEERWCSEFPRLFATLKARGIPIEVTRLLQAGEAPVQVVDVASLPARTAEERRHAEPLARSIK